MTDNFEKDIDVPSKEIIMYDYNAKDYEQCNPDSVCCYCKNIACYKLEEELEQYKKSKQASYEQLQKRCNELELENRTLARENLKLNSAVDFITLTEHSAINKYNKLKQTLQEIKEFVKNEMIPNCDTSIILQKISEVLDENI